MWCSYRKLSQHGRLCLSGCNRRLGIRRRKCASTLHVKRSYGAAARARVGRTWSDKMERSPRRCEADSDPTETFKETFLPSNCSTSSVSYWSDARFDWPDNFTDVFNWVERIAISVATQCRDWPRREGRALDGTLPHTRRDPESLVGYGPDIRRDPSASHADDSGSSCGKFRRRSTKCKRSYCFV